MTRLHHPQAALAAVRAIACAAALGLAVLAGAAARPAAAQNRLSDVADMVEVSLRAGWQEPDGRRMAGLAIRMAPRWKTYWRSPGEAGIPPVFDWSASRNLRDVQVIWPAPKVFTLSGLSSIGYAGEVVLPLAVTPVDPDRPVDLRLALEIGVCEEICVPVSGRLAVRLAGPGARDAAIEAALARRTQDASELGLPPARCRISPQGRNLLIEAHLPWRGDARPQAVAVELDNPALWVGPAELDRVGDEVVARAQAMRIAKGPVMVDRSTIRLTVIGAGRAVTYQGCGSG